MRSKAPKFASEGTKASTKETQIKESHDNHDGKLSLSGNETSILCAASQTIIMSRKPVQIFSGQGITRDLQVKAVTTTTRRRAGLSRPLGVIGKITIATVTFSVCLCVCKISGTIF